ncbi:MAG TPA: hypothetical protein VIP09_02200 [Dehalococcoidia bacterium]|jgi:hypothetical protein
MNAPAASVVYEYATDNSKKVQDIADWCSKRSSAGWDFVQAFADQDRYICIFRRPKR